MTRVLLVEDHGLIRKGLADIIRGMQGEQFELEEAASAEEALEILRDRPVDILISDIRLPGLNGLDLLERAARQAPQVRRILISAYDRFDYACQGIRLGAEDYLLKPIKRSDLAAVLSRMLGRAIVAPEEDARGSGAMIAHLGPGLSATVQAAIDYVDGHYMKDLSLSEVAEAVCKNYNYLSKLFREETGMTFVDYLLRVRMEHSRHLLLDVSLNVEQVARAVGFSDAGYYTRQFKKVMGVTPNQYRLSQM